MVCRNVRTKFKAEVCLENSPEFYFWKIFDQKTKSSKLTCSDKIGLDLAKPHHDAPVFLSSLGFYYLLQVSAPLLKDGGTTCGAVSLFSCIQVYQFRVVHDWDFFAVLGEPFWLHVLGFPPWRNMETLFFKWFFSSWA